MWAHFQFFLQLKGADIQLQSLSDFSMTQRLFWLDRWCFNDGSACAAAQPAPNSPRGVKRGLLSWKPQHNSSQLRTPTIHWPFVIFFFVSRRTWTTLFIHKGFHFYLIDQCNRCLWAVEWDHFESLLLKSKFWLSSCQVCLTYYHQWQLWLF